MQESGLIEIFPLISTLAAWGLCSVLAHPVSPQGAPLGAAAVAMGGSRQPVCLHPEFPQGSPLGGNSSGLMIATSFVY